jgi:excisionase family DNA binding protein
MFTTSGKHARLLLRSAARLCGYRPIVTQPLDPGDRWLTVGQAAAVAQVHVETIRRWGRSGLLTEYRTPGKQRRYKLSDVQDAIRRDKPPDEPPE